MKCGECDYWDRDFDGFLGDTYKPCKHPNKSNNFKAKIQPAYSENAECHIEKYLPDIHK